MKERGNISLSWKDWTVRGVCDHVIERRGFEIRRLFKSFEFFYKKNKIKLSVL